MSINNNYLGIDIGYKSIKCSNIHEQKGKTLFSKKIQLLHQNDDIEYLFFTVLEILCV